MKIRQRKKREQRERRERRGGIEAFWSFGDREGEKERNWRSRISWGGEFLNF